MKNIAVRGSQNLMLPTGALINDVQSLRNHIFQQATFTWHSEQNFAKGIADLIRITWGHDTLDTVKYLRLFKTFVRVEEVHNTQ